MMKDTVFTSLLECRQIIGLNLRPCSSAFSENNDSTVSLKHGVHLHESIFTTSDDLRSLLLAFPVVIQFPEPEEDIASLKTLLESLLCQQADLHLLFLWDVPLNLLVFDFIPLPLTNQVVEVEMGSLIVTHFPVVFQVCSGHILCCLLLCSPYYYNIVTQGIVIIYHSWFFTTK